MRILSIDIGIRNLALCIADWDGILGETIDATYREHMQIANWQVIDITRGMEELKFNKISANRNFIYRQFLINVRDQLSTIDYTDVDMILIEDQAKFNEMTKMIQAYVQAYYVYYQSHLTLNIVSSRNKTTVVRNYVKTNLPEGQLIMKTSSTKSHAKNKKESIWMCNHILQDGDPMTDMFRRSKKQDDLAETLIHIIGYITQHDMA